MGNVEALKYFSLSNAVGSKPAYGPHGHLGMNILIFEASAVGFMEAELLCKKFEDAGTGREGWRCSDRVLLYPNGESKLYGYMAKKTDVEIFNQYFIGLLFSHSRLVSKVHVSHIPLLSSVSDHPYFLLGR